MIKILFVDDEKGITDSLTSFFRPRGFFVQTAESGEEAVRIAENDRPDMIFLDINMKGMNGVEALKRIKAHDSSIKVIMLTVADGADMVKKARESGADDFIAKPFMMDSIDDIVIKTVQEIIKERP